MKLKIGLIVRNQEKSRPYLSALDSVGLLPVPIAIPSSVKASDFQGVVLTGGTDIDPELYGQKRGEFTEHPDRQRDDFEMAFADQALRLQLPMLAICRGTQLINVLCGGSLIQHLPRAQAKQLKQPRKASVEPNTLLKFIVENDSLDINPRHHQGIGDLGRGLFPTSIADDYVIESIELEGHPAFLGIGWHPEDRVSADPPNKADQALFKWFACVVQSRVERRSSFGFTTPKAKPSKSVAAGESHTGLEEQEGEQEQARK